MERILGLDIGTARIGLALSDPLGWTAQPFEVIHRKKDNAVERIAEVVEIHGVEKIVVGRPLQLDGKEGQAVASVEAFVAKLTKRIELPVHWWDERLTTKSAERVMIGDGVRRQKRKQSIDKIAAALILQSYLDAHASQ